jgi:hypothetical protein
MNVLRAGVFNGGFMAFSQHDEARRFLAWWREKTFQECVRDVRNGVHFEQRWLDFVPSLTTDHRILRDPGLNVGHWNLPDRDIRAHNGRVTAKGVPCRVFRFSGYEPDRPRSVSKYNPRYTVASTGDAAQVFARYRALLMDAHYEETRRLPYAYEHFDNGVVIPERARRIYRRLGERARRFGDPFETAPAGSYYRWYKARRLWLPG